MSLCALKSLDGLPLLERERRPPSLRLERPGLIWSLVYLFSLICCQSRFFSASKKSCIFSLENLQKSYSLLKIHCFFLDATSTPLHYVFFYLTPIQPSNSYSVITFSRIQVSEPQNQQSPVIYNPKLALMIDLIIYLFVFLFD